MAERRGSAVRDLRRYFDELGRAVEARWSAAGRHHRSLPDIALGALEEIPAPAALNAPTVLECLARDDGMPEQRAPEDRFGEPPTVMYKREGLEVHALTWMDGSTSIHQHGFDGAFRVAQGSSLHVQYGFSCEERLAGGRIALGALPLRSTEILRVGAVRSVVSGPEFIHALFHLQCPSVTVVVRNGWSDRPFPQLEYRHPGIGFDSLEADPALAMRLRGLRALQRIDPSEASRVAHGLIAAEDLWTSFRLLDDWFGHFGNDGRLADLLAAFERRFSDLGVRMREMYEDQHRRSRILMRRTMLHEQRHRLLMALLVNLTDAAAISSSVAALFPGDDPVDVTIRLMEELASPPYRGSSGLTLGQDDVAHLRRLMSGGRTGEAMGALGEHWRPPQLVEALFGG